MATEHQFIYWHKGRGLYELDRESVANAPKEFEDLYLPKVIIAGNQIKFGGEVYGYISNQKPKYRYRGSEKFTKPKAHTVFTVAAQ
uniref:Uncharacterized protein n=1 Tax=Siphoviridae sp. ct6bU4 TaxID=2825344 RepID=A0A8S5VAL2_9CAUD|nr:MAG TPA: hypothetical protein [Siphoviridae sp. ct6bU4]